MTQDLQRALEAPERLAALAETGLLDSPEQTALDRYVRLVRNALGAPVGLVSLVDDHRQFFSSAAGLPEPWASKRETPLSHSFCKHVVAQQSELIVPDAPEHPLVKDNLAIPDLGVKAYAGVPIRTADGHVLGSFCAVDVQPREWTDRELTILRDLAEGVGEVMDLLRRARRAELSETSLAKLNDSLMESRDDQALAARAAVHDLRTPLSVMLLGVSNLLSHDASRSYPEIGKLLGTMKRNVSHASSLVSTMYDITRLATDGAPSSLVDVAELLREVCGDLQAPEGMTLAYEAGPAPAAVRADPTSLRRCIENLVSNALRFAESRVEVLHARSEDEVIIAIQDDGPGLPDAEAYRRVWEPNVRYHSDEGRSGSGLGLSIVKEIVQRHEGHVRARPSAKLGGAKFILHLPLATDG